MLCEGGALGGDVAARARRLGRPDARRDGGRVRRARRSTSPTTTRLAAPLPQPRVDVLAAVVGDERLRHRALRAVGARGRRRRRPRGAARRRAQLGPHRPRAATAASSSASARRSATRCSSTSAGRRRRGSRSSARARSTRSRPAARAEVEDVSVELAGLLHAARRWSSRRTRRRAGPSIEDADVIVAGGRGLGAPEGFSLVEELAAGARRRGRRDARRRRRRLVPVLGAGRPDGQDRLAEALRRARHLRRDPAQGRDAGLEHDRRDQQGPERADLRVRRPRRRRRPARRSSRS